MKRITFSVSVMAMLLLMGLFITNEVKAQDKAQILEQIIDMPALQQHYPLNATKTQKEITVIQFPISFPANFSMANSDKEVVLMSREEAKSKKVEDYFMIRSIENNANITTVTGHYFYNYNYSNDKASYVAIVADFEKSGSELKLVKSDVKGGAF